MKPEQIETCIVVGLGFATVIGLVALHADASLVSVITGGLIGYLTPRSPAIPAAAILLFVSLGATVVGCGPALSDASRAEYAGEVAHCETDERAIVARPATTLEADRAALEAERARCDEARHEIETPALDGGV